MPAVVARVVNLCVLARGGWEGSEVNQLKGFEPAARWNWAAFFFAAATEARRHRGTEIKLTGLNGGIAASDGLTSNLNVGSSEHRQECLCH
jgi:hypothetical protein